MGKIAYSTANENLAIYYKLMSVMGNNPYFYTTIQLRFSN